MADDMGNVLAMDIAVIPVGSQFLPETALPLQRNWKQKQEKQICLWSAAKKKNNNNN